MGGFSVFDDVAFYYLMQAVITVFLVPWTLIKVVSYLWEKLQKSKSKDSNYFSASNHDYELQGTKLADNRSWRQKYFTPKNIVFVLLWIFFLYQCAQLPTYLARELSSWDPVDILGVPADASQDDIKTAYKTLSLKWHPDKHPAEMKEEAQAKFIEILRAYKALTDPKAIANMRKFGNIDGHQGVNMTIGLPSFLTNEENSLKTLLVYFLIMIVFPPVCVYMWWSGADKIHETGVHRETISNYWHLVGEHYGPKFLLAVMCSAAEYKELGRDHLSEKEADRRKLRLEVQEYLVKTQASKCEWVDRAHVLILAYLLRVPIPLSLEGDMRIVLRDAHKLLGALFNICLARKFVKATMGCIELMQMVTQAMAPNSSPLLQLPYLTSKEIRLAGKKRMDNLEAFRAADDEKRMKVYSGHTDEEWKRIKEVCDRLPDLAMECQTSVDGEDGIFEGDLVTIKVTLERIKPGVTRKTQSRKIAPVSDGDGESTDITTDDKDDIDDSVVSDLPKAAEGEEEDSKVVDQRERKLLNTLPVAKAPPSKFGKDDQQVAVHSAFYPYPKTEKWVLLLFLKNKNKTLSLLAIQKVPDFREKEVVELRMKVGEKGVWPYELHAKCDSYVGCDVSLSFKITVNKLSKAEEDRRDEKFAQSKLIGLDENEDTADKPYEGKWYYAGFASFWELGANASVVLLLFFFVMNFLQQRGYWQLYVDPVIAKAFVYVAPIYNSIAPVLRPVLGPISSAVEKALIALGNFMTVDPEELIRVKRGDL